MIERETKLLEAIDGLADDCPNYQNEVVRFLISDENVAGREARLLGALVMMVDQLLERRDNQEVDTLAMSARTEAVQALVALGLMEFIHYPRFAKWTDRGLALLAETTRQQPIRRTEAANWTRRNTIRWAKRAAVGACIAGGCILFLWLAMIAASPH